MIVDGGWMNVDGYGKKQKVIPTGLD